jgi:membrane protease YdiL (CAAX protease family)
MLPVALVVGWAMGVHTPSVGDFAVFSGLPSSLGVVGLFLVLLLVNGYGEETGWRGFAVPHLEQRMSPLAAALVVAPLWALWHLPSFFVINNYRQFTAAQVVGWFLGLTCGSIVLTWLYDGSGGSILLVVVWHALYNVVGATAAAHGTLGALVSMVVMVQAIVLVVLYVRAGRQHGPASRGSASRGFGWMNHAVNPLVRAGLRTPVVRTVLGRRLALVGFTGRRSGRALVAPVRYVRAGDTVWVLPGHPDRKVWWHNLEDPGATASLLLAGDRLGGPAAVLREGDEGFAAGLETYLRGNPAAAPSVGVGGSTVEPSIPNPMR